MNDHRIVLELKQGRDRRDRWDQWRCLDCGQVWLWDQMPKVGKFGLIDHDFCPAAEHPMYAAAKVADPRHALTWIDHYPLAPWYLKKDEPKRRDAYVAVGSSEWRFYWMPWSSTRGGLAELDLDRWHDEGGA